MTTSLADRAAAIMTAVPRIAAPLPELATRLDTTPETLGSYLEEDDRFVVVRPTVFPDLTHLPAADRADYAAALQAAGVEADVLVVPSAPAAHHAGGSLDALLHDTVLRLLDQHPRARLAASAERLRTVLAAAIDPAGTDPSTTRPRDPRPRRSAPRPGQRPQHAPPPTPGSRPG